MKADIKAQWVAALRSGDYKQGTGYLRRDDGDGDRFCCLGVLCELAVKAEVIPPAERMGPFNFRVFGYADPAYADTPGVNESTLPEKVREWAGLGDCNPVIGSEDVDEEDDEGPAYPLAASEANDDYDWDFNRIADAIEANIPGE